MYELQQVMKAPQSSGLDRLASRSLSRNGPHHVSKNPSLEFLPRCSRMPAALWPQKASPQFTGGMQIPLRPCGRQCLSHTALVL